MGADGQLYLMRESKFRDAFPDVDPFIDLKLKSTSIHDVETILCYQDSNSNDDSSSANVGNVKRISQLEGWRDSIEDYKRTEGRMDPKDPTFVMPRAWLDSWEREWGNGGADELAKLLGDPDLPKQRRNQEALEWFFQNAWNEELWT